MFKFINDGGRATANAKPQRAKVAVAGATLPQA